MSNTYYVTIGNSDDKLTQQRWARYCHTVVDLCEEYADEIHVVGFTTTDSQWQTMIVACVLADEEAAQLKDALLLVRAEFDQDSIAFAKTTEVEFL